MNIYSLISDNDTYAIIGFNKAQIERLCGKDPRNRFNHLNFPKSYVKEITEPLEIHFSDPSKYTGSEIPDIQAASGKLFLSQAAYDVIHKIIEKDGEFFPVVYEKGNGYIFNPLQLAEDYDALNEKLSVKNEWGEVENVGFIEDKIQHLGIFKSKFAGLRYFFCFDEFKQAIENTNLKGVKFTPDLGWEFNMAKNNDV